MPSSLDQPPFSVNQYVGIHSAHLAHRCGDSLMGTTGRTVADYGAADGRLGVTAPECSEVAAALIVQVVPDLNDLLGGSKRVLVGQYSHLSRPS
jgi:hypothetical protein